MLFYYLIAFVTIMIAAVTAIELNHNRQLAKIAAEAEAFLAARRD